MSKITVRLKAVKYDIIIQNNLLDFVENYLNMNQLTLVVTDEVVGPLYLHKLKSKFFKSNFFSYTIKSGESSKNFNECSSIINYMIKEKLTKDTQIIALGGGVVGDLAGFVASIYLRGVSFVQIPTTLLSQVDSSIGGKVAVNTDTLKNSIGSFYQPSIVLIDPTVLSTLPPRELRSGMAEVIKMAALLDAKLFTLLKTEDALLHLEEIITKTLKLKKHIVELDPYDQNLRQILNFGHTIGHAIESHYNYKKYLHGEAVAIGMVKITDHPMIKKELIEVLSKYNLPISDSYNGSELYKYIANDKKVSNSSINLIKLEDIGKYKIERVKLVDLFNML
jgi:3-dehydroquinate synthase